MDEQIISFINQFLYFLPGKKNRIIYWHIKMTTNVRLENIFDIKIIVEKI